MHCISTHSAQSEALEELRLLLTQVRKRLGSNNRLALLFLFRTNGSCFNKAEQVQGRGMGPTNSLGRPLFVPPSQRPRPLKPRVRRDSLPARARPRTRWRRRTHQGSQNNEGQFWIIRPSPLPLSFLLEACCLLARPGTSCGMRSPRTGACEAAASHFPWRLR